MEDKKNYEATEPWSKKRKVKYITYKKTKKHIKNLVHSLLFLTRFSKNDLLSTESENIIPSLHAVTIMS